MLAAGIATMRKILILTASFGDGHNAAAGNLREGIELITDDAKVEVLDLFESTYGTLNTLLKRWLLDHPKAAESPLVRVFELFAGTSIDQKGAVIAQDLKLLEPILWVDDKGFGVIVVEVIDLQRYRFGAGSSPPIKLEVAPAMPGACNDHVTSPVQGDVTDSPSAQVQLNGGIESAGCSRSEE